MFVIGEDQFTAPQDLLGNAALLQTMIGHYQAVQLEQLADYARVREDDEFAALEVAALLHISDRAALRRLRFARTLTERLPQSFAALKQGWIEEVKAQLIADAVECLSDKHAQQVEARVLDKAARQTPAQLRNQLAKVVLAVDPEGAEQRRTEKVRERRVEVAPTEPGQAMLTIFHTEDRIAAIHTAIKTRAHQLKALGGELRTLPQLEADVACDLLLGCVDGGGRTVEVHLTVPATTALGWDAQPGEVDGMAITAHAARELLAEASRWRWVRTDPTTGTVTDVTTARYTPPQALRTLIRVRDRTCRFPGCTRPARHCEVDHRVPWPEGATCDTNCACLCKHHHRAKHDGKWNVRAITPGHYEWTSPLGFTHPVKPEPVAQPQPPPPADDPPPF